MSTIPPIPAGFHSITPHLCVKGAAKAIEFYKAAFGAEEIRRMPMPGDERLMHAAIRIGDSIVMLVDDFPEWRGGKGGTPEALGGSPVTIHLYVTDARAAMAQAEAAGCNVTMPVNEAFWGDLFGACTDPFGHHWTIATQVRIPTPEESAAALAAMFSESGQH